MNAEQQIQQPASIKSNKKRLKRRLIIVSIIILALLASTITIFSIVGLIPGIWATIISAVLTIFSLVFGVLPLVPADDKSAVPVSPLVSQPPFAEPLQPAPSTSPVKSTSPFR